MTGRILVVDDVATNRIVLKVKLAAACHEVIQAATGEQALEMARKTRPDLVLLDVVMPDLDGITVCRRLKADPATADIPVVMMTARDDLETKLRALAAGAGEFLTKPVQEATLMARVRSLLRAGDVLRELRERNQTCREMGFSEPPAILARPGWVALVSESPAHAAMLATKLRPMIKHRLTLMSRKEALALRSDERGTVQPDVFLMMPDPDAPQRNLAWLAELRAKTAARHASIIALVRDKDPQEAAMALDLGANDIVPHDVTPQELALRIEMQIRQKISADQLRATVTDGLKQAMLDPLTGLFNRRYAEHHLARIAGQSEGQARPFALVMVDIDRFKSVNDRHGHGAGDAVLRQVATRLRDNLRPVDLVARFGGEEFLIALPDTPLSTARTMAERLRRAVADTPFTLPGGGMLTVTISAGLAMGRDGGARDISALVAQADRALYASKSEGRNAVTVSRPAA